VLDGDAVRAARSEPMTRGHQERIAVLAREVMAEAGMKFVDLTRIAVTVGPGSFTGLRVGLSFAKGLATALSIPCVGVNTLEALAASAERPASWPACSTPRWARSICRSSTAERR
jgi:tRNA threonylcarbamoyladenosine biosynthesis protein TsaB